MLRLVMEKPEFWGRKPSNHDTPLRFAIVFSGNAYALKPQRTFSCRQDKMASSLSESELSLKRGMPVSIITGFLGSGKTTLLNHILSNNQDLKVAVLVNEFGDINIDSQLLVSIDEDMVELSNGCICCTINDGLVDAVYRVMESGVDYLVIETTGVADPLPIILTFLS